MPRASVRRGNSPANCGHGELAADNAIPGCDGSLA